VIGTIRLCHPAPIHRKSHRTNSDPVEGILLSTNADHVSLPLCRTCFPTTLGAWSDAVLTVIITAVPLFIGSEFLLWVRCVLCIIQAVDATDDISSQRGSGKSSLIKTIFNVDMSVCTRSSLHSFLTHLRARICKRAPTNVSGMTAEFRPHDNRHLIVHECSVFKPGEFQAIRDFITTRNHKSRQASEKLHAIW
jgi:hypothetical protein